MTSYPTDPETWLKLPYSYRAVHARQVRWYPGDSYLTLPSSLIDKGDVSIANAEGDTLDGFMAALLNGTSRLLPEIPHLSRGDSFGLGILF